MFSTEGVEGPPGPAKPTDPAVTEPVAGPEEPKGPEGGDTVEGKSQCKLIFFKRYTWNKVEFDCHCTATDAGAFCF